MTIISEKVLALQFGSLWWRSARQDDKPLKLIGEGEAELWLRRLSFSPVGRASIRSAALSIHPAPHLNRWSQAELIEHVSRAIQHGRLMAVATAESTYAVTERDSEQHQQIERSQKETPLTWIAIRLVNDDIPPKPVPFERYIVRCEDGFEHEGSLDRNGYAMIKDVDPGTCSIAFPDLHGPDWRPL